MTPFDDLELLRVLLRIVESRSISAAARSLKVPQPTLSRHLRTLETRAGARLLQRDTHHLHLTDAGQKLLESARSLLELAEEATERLRVGQTTLQGHLRLFATIDLGQSLVSRLIARFLTEHAQVTAELGYTNRPVQMIEEGYDVGIVAGHVTDERLVARPVASLTRTIVAAPELLRRSKAAKEPGELKSWPWAALSGRQFGGTANTATLVSSAGAVKTLRIEPILTTEGVTSLREVVLSGLAIAVLPDWLVGSDLASGRLLPVLKRWSSPPIPLNVVYLADRQRPSRVSAFIAFVEQMLPGWLTKAAQSHS
jgi:DNA-binding transcriptional LysR family regulator